MISDPQQPWLAAVLDFLDDSVFSILLNLITLYDIYLDVNIANMWQIQAYLRKFPNLNFNCFP